MTEDDGLDEEAIFQFRFFRQRYTKIHLAHCQAKLCFLVKPNTMMQNRMNKVIKAFSNPTFDITAIQIPQSILIHF